MSASVASAVMGSSMMPMRSSVTVRMSVPMMESTMISLRVNGGYVLVMVWFLLSVSFEYSIFGWVLVLGE